MGALTVVGYVFYRFSQTLPALIRWPIRLFCSLTGLSTLWGWVTRLVGTLRIIKTLYKWMSQLWHFLVRISSKFGWISRITGTSDDDLSELHALRIVLLRPADGRASGLADFLLGPVPSTTTTTDSAPDPHLLQTSKRTIALSSGEITVVDTPALPGLTLDEGSRARQALRGLQLSSPGPHAFIVETPIATTDLHQDLNRLAQASADVYGSELTDFMIPVVTHKHSLSRRRIEDLLHAQPGSHRRGPLLCPHRPEAVNVSMERTADDVNAARVGLLKRVLQMKKTKGCFIHELQRREERAREELLDAMATELAAKLRHCTD
ncbi:unnamed protein product [Knipowitschia caucasica]|uniref:AIG1-type G domain-containing protein n=1 Tax=Knipowitschia caucasica TaxID=637954 RepID=A0AAV2LR74_KNICA